MSKLISFLILLNLFLFSGCNLQKQTPLNKKYQSSESSFFTNNEYSDINKGINEIANQLLMNISRNHQINYKLVVTSLVNLDDFDSTSSFGRMISESLINEMHSRRFKVIDFRTRELMTINPAGEFVLTREADQLKDEMPFALMLVGTYTLLDNKRIVINTRIMDIFSSEVLSTSRILYEFKECEKYHLCQNDAILKKRVPNEIPIKEEK
jgi:TolB-like protein